MMAPSFTSISNPWSSLLVLPVVSCLHPVSLSLSGISFPFSYPSSAHWIQKTHLSTTFSGYLPQRKKVKESSLQNSNHTDRNLGSYLELVTVWISGSLLQFVITSWALKHCPNMFCCESTDPVWHYFKERGQQSSRLITVIRNGGGGLRHS